jgi:hypothetical protein
VAISLLLGVIHVPSLQTTSVFTIEELNRILQHGVLSIRVHVLSFEAFPPFGANIFVLQSIEQKLGNWVGKIIFTPIPKKLSNNNIFTSYSHRGTEGMPNFSNSIQSTDQTIESDILD